MTRSFIALLTVSLLAFSAFGNPEPPASSAPEPPAAMPWAVEVYREYCPELTDEAPIEDCWTGYDEEELHLVVVTDMPTLVPAEQDTIPILTAAPPSTPPAPLAALPRAVEVYRASCPGLVAEVYVEDCWPGYVDEALHLVVVTDAPDLIPAEVDAIPTLTMAPPDPPHEEDVDGTEGEADTAEGEADDTEGGTDTAEEEAVGADTQQDGESTEGETSSEPQNPPIAGIPYATALEIFSRHPFNSLDEVWDVRLEADGIVVRTTQPDLIPSTFEGLPVRAELIRVRSFAIFGAQRVGSQ